MMQRLSGMSRQAGGLNERIGYDFIYRRIVVIVKRPRESVEGFISSDRKTFFLQKTPRSP